MADDDLSGTVLDGRYQVIEPIAEGAMGSVYRGERLKLGRAVAIKIMHQELPDELASRQRFEREAKLMALLEHPNCVSVIDFGLHDEKPFLVMDLVRGTSLLEVLDTQGHIEIQRAGDIIRQVLSGLAHAHELGIVHRDIKPANIMISEKAGFGSQVRILDFGLARLTESNTKLTTGIVVGTPNYMAPEQCKGGDIDARTDLYACGVMLFEMLTGRKPFVADDPIQVVRKHLMEKPPTLASVASGEFGDLEAVVAKALAKAPKDRFDSAVEMSKAVEQAVNKIAKISTAALFARAVPGTHTGIGTQQATASGWNVPANPNAPPPTAPPPTTPPPSAAPPSPRSESSDAAQKAHHGARAGSGSESMPSASTNAATDASPGIGYAATSVVIPASNASTPGVPNTSLSIPPTRPASSAPRGVLADLPFTKKQLMIGGGALLALILLIAVIAGGGSSKKGTKSKKPGGGSSAVVKAEPKADPLPAIIERGKAMIESGDEDAADVLKAARKSYPDSAELAFLTGKAYFNQLWWTDGVENFRDAVTLDESYKTDPDLLKTVLKGFLTTPDIDYRIRDFMRELGPPMRPYLEETAEKHPKKALRARARAELNASPD